MVEGSGAAFSERNGFVSHRGYVLVFFGLWFENGFGWCFVADGSRGSAPDRDKCRGISDRGLGWLRAVSYTHLTAIKGGEAGFHGGTEGFFVHVPHHQDAPGGVVLNDGGDEAAGFLKVESHFGVQ